MVAMSRSLTIAGFALAVLLEPAARGQSPAGQSVPTDPPATAGSPGLPGNTSGGPLGNVAGFSPSDGIGGEAGAALSSGLGEGAGGAASAFGMIGDRGPGVMLRQFPTPPTTPGTPNQPPPAPNPRVASAFVPSIRGLKIAENQSPRPQDRVFFTFDYFNNVNGALNRRFDAPVRDIQIYREIFGFEKTIFEGNGSIGFRLPLDTLTSKRTVPARFQGFGGQDTSLGDLGLFAKFIMAEDKATGSLISTGLAITAPTGPNSFAGASYLGGIHTTMIQPFLGYIWNRDRFYVHGFSAFEFPVDPAQASFMYNDVGAGYFLYRDDTGSRFLTAIAPTFEAHVNSPLNHRDVYNIKDPSGSATVVNLTYGVNFEFNRQSVLTAGFVNPVTGPKPFDFEFLLLFNYRFGKTARRALPVISG